MNNVQPGILGPVPRLAMFLTFTMKPGSEPQDALEALRDATDGDEVVVGIGLSTVIALGRKIEGLRTFPALVGAGFEVPSTPEALWCWLRGDDRGHLLHKARRIQKEVSRSFALSKAIDAFQYGPSLDLTGYEEGTENPTGDKATEVAVARGRGQGLDGSSFVAVQQWVHDLDRFGTMPPDERDRVIGRRASDNEEMEDAPESAHVKRTAQESFEPEAFVLRRSMPWSGDAGEGLVFVAFAASFDPFEALLKRMVGAEDGVPDALFRFTRPISGSYYWCPPLAGGKLNLSLLGI